MLFKSSLSLALTLCLLLTAVGQQPTSQPQTRPDDDEDDVVRITSNLVQIDAIVTDKQGRHVTDLRPEDFEIREDGRQRQITDFSYISTVPAASTSSSPTSVAAAAPSRNTKSPAPAVTAAPPPARTRAPRPEQTRRIIVLAVDDLCLSSESMPYVKRALRKFVAEQMQEGDLAALVRTSTGAGALQQLTADKRQLSASVERLRWLPRGCSGGPSFSSGSPEEVPDIIGTGVSGADAAESRRLQSFTRGVLGALDFIVRGLRDLPGRKSVVLFSDGLSVFNSGEATRTNPRGMSGVLADALRRLTDSAGRASVVFYAVHARGLPTLGLEASEEGLEFGTLGVRQGTLRPVLSGRDTRLENRRAAFREGQDGLVVLSRETGGFAVLGNNDLIKGLTQVVEDQRGFYLLGYRPDEKTFDPETGHRRFRSISIKVKRPGLTVRTRSGFYGFADDRQPSAPPATREGQLVAALASPFTSGDVALRLTAFFGNEAPEGSFVRSLLHIDTRSLTFKETADGWRESAVDVLAAVFNSDGSITDQVNQTHTIRVRREAYERSLAAGLVHTLNVPVKRAGGYQLRVAVRDVATQRVGSAHQFVEVPDVDEGRLALSGMVISGIAAESGNPSGNSPGRVPPESESQSSPALRRFRAGDRMDFGYIIYNARLDAATNRPRLTTQVSIFRDGRAVFSGTPEAFEAGQQTDLKRLVAAGRLRLGADLAPGEYVLQAVVTDALAPEKSRTVAQWLDFEIVR